MAARQQGRPSLSPRREAAFVALFIFWALFPGTLPRDPRPHGHPTEKPECEGHQVDVCGVCAGDGSSCEVVSGTFTRSFLSVGYHKILEIPLGSQNIRIQEAVKSKNYLALRTTSGASILNGNWAIDRPGIFFAAGTELTYRRPNEIRSRTGESITAPGPISQELHLFLIYQQPGPVVYYEYTLPRQNAVIPRSAPPPVILPLETSLLHTSDGHSYHPADENSVDGVHPNQVQSNILPHTTDYPSGQLDPGPLSPYVWRRTGISHCSATCGTGKRQVLFTCVKQLGRGEWSDCSKPCGPGVQRRQVLCRQPLGDGSLAAAGPSQCRHLEPPETLISCQLKICSEWHIHSEWSPCSVPCGVGQRTREVRCVDSLGDVVMDEECNLGLRPEDVQNCDAGPCARSWFFTRWSDRCSSECGEGSRSRTVACLMNHISSLPLDGCGDERPEELIHCNTGPCERRPDWYTGPWGQCSAECGNGMQTRITTCLLQTNGSLEVTTPSDCAHLARPPSTRSCNLKKCGAKWFVTEWSSCSRSCDGGYRVREVRCLADDLTPSAGCDPSLTPEEREECNSHPCVPEYNEKCRDMYYNCNVVVQARLCVYSYYRTACCASCSRGRGKETQLLGRR
ncbi:hypothetical protein GJAV_G00250630 [Gymnothorax javanicus]|nr:hypothetical protein GJAV_G00250630 [Gymnothorax javanicus]